MYEVKGLEVFNEIKQALKQAAPTDSPAESSKTVIVREGESPADAFLRELLEKYDRDFK